MTEVLAAVETFHAMIGKTMKDVVLQVASGHAIPSNNTAIEEIRFYATSGDKFAFYHSQDCCEYVRVEEIVGDVNDLIGHPILVAEQVSSEGAAAPEDKRDECHTWTFYRFATVKGTVVIRWLGESNGYYSESVDYTHTPPPTMDSEAS